MRSCTKKQLNALVYKALEVASEDPNKKDLLKRWSNKAASYLQVSPRNKKGNIAGNY